MKNGKWMLFGEGERGEDNDEIDKWNVVIFEKLTRECGVNSITNSKASKQIRLSFIFLRDEIHTQQSRDDPKRVSTQTKRLIQQKWNSSSPVFC